MELDKVKQTTNAIMLANNINFENKRTSIDLNEKTPQKVESNAKSIEASTIKPIAILKSNKLEPISDKTNLISKNPEIISTDTNGTKEANKIASQFQTIQHVNNPKAADLNIVVNSVMNNGQTIKVQNASNEPESRSKKLNQQSLLKTFNAY